MPKFAKHVAIIIVNWNGARDTIPCLTSLSRMDTTGVNVRIVVVDNGSTDGSADLIESKFPHVVVLRNIENLGFTGGNNRGIRYALGMGDEYIWLLNNDTKVDVHAMIPLLAACDASGGLVGSKIYFAPGQEFHASRYTKKDQGNVLWYAGGLIDWDNMYASHKGVDEVDHGQYNQQENTAFITGCSLLCSATVYGAIGLLDERYYLYLEDLDFSLRAKSAGYALTYVPASIVWHTNAGSTGKPGSHLHEYYQTRNRLLLGFQFAPLRTKFALIREAIRFYLSGGAVKRSAVSDFIYKRFGKQFELNS